MKSQRNLNKEQKVNTGQDVNPERGGVMLVLALISLAVTVFILLLTVLIFAVTTAGSASAFKTIDQPDRAGLNGEYDPMANPDLGGDIIEATPGEARLVCAFIPGISHPRTNALDWRVARRWAGVKRELDARGIRFTANYAFRTSCQQSKMRGTYGIAAPPGASMHESGAAFDINGIGRKAPGSKYGFKTPLGQQIIPIFEKFGFRWLPHDPMHLEMRPEQLGEPNKFSLIRKMQADFNRGNPTGGCRGDRCAVDR